MDQTDDELFKLRLKYVVEHRWIDQHHVFEQWIEWQA